jgi:sulfonate transport system substrate-binding protein
MTKRARFRLFHLLLILVAVMAPALTCAAQETVIRIGVASVGVGGRQYFGGSPGATARAGDYVEHEFRDDPQVKIVWSFFRGAGPAVNEALANEQLDFAYQGDLPSLIGRANGLKTRILMASGANVPEYLAVPPDSDIKGIKDLKGRKVAIFRGTNGQLAIDKILAANGLSERDLRVFNMDAPTAGAAVATKDIDAVFGSMELFDLQDRGIVKIVYDSKTDNPAFGRRSHLLVTEAFETVHPDLTARVVKAFVRAAQWSSDEANRAAVFELWAKSGLPASAYQQDFNGQTLKFRNTPLIDDFARAQYKAQAEQANAYKLLRGTVDIDSWFDLRFLDAALHDLNLDHYWTRYDAAGRPEGS